MELVNVDLMLHSLQKSGWVSGPFKDKGGTVKGLPGLQCFTSPDSSGLLNLVGVVPGWF